MTTRTMPPELALAKKIMKVIGKQSPRVVVKAIMIVLKTTELMVDTGATK